MHVTQQQDRAISLPEVAQRLGVSVRTVRRMIEVHEIRAFKVLGQWRIRESEIERVMNGEPIQGAEPGEPLAEQ
jgi:excisionase family DNA binding protein